MSSLELTKWRKPKYYFQVEHFFGMFYSKYIGMNLTDKNKLPENEFVELKKVFTIILILFY